MGKKTTKTLTRVSTLVLAAAMLVGCGKGLPGATGVNGHGLAAQGKVAASRPGEVVVKFRGAAARNGLLAKLNLRTVRTNDKIGAVLVKAADVKAAIAQLKADPAVVYAEPNYIAKAISSVPVPQLGFNVRRGGDELLEKLWGMKRIGADQSWQMGMGAGVRVAVVDTGIDYNHPDFDKRVVDKGKDFAGNNPDAFDDHYHGTHCAGTIGAGLGNGGVVGVAPAVGLVAVKVLSADGSGSYEGVANGIVYAADSGAAIISMSLGGPASSAVLEDAVKYAIGKGALIVAAMGNDGLETPSYPAALPGVMAVGATNGDDYLPNFTNSGKHISVVAPGVEILSTTPNSNYEELSGTSMSTPHVAGLAALLKGNNPTWTAAQLRERIEQTAKDGGIQGYDKYFGHGRVDALKAMSLR